MSSNNSHHQRDNNGDHNNKQQTHVHDVNDINLALDANSMQGLTPKSEDATKQSRTDRAPLTGQLHQLLRDFSLRTTAHGWGRVGAAPSKTVKVLWFSVTLVALVLSGIHISLLTAHYLSFTSEVKWQVSVDEIVFPSVSLCNIQPMSIIAAEQLMTNTSSQFYKWYNITRYLKQLSWPHFDDEQRRSMQAMLGRLQQPIGYYENIGDESLLVGHQSHDFILGCTFSQTACAHSNFTLFQNAQYFNCYTFHGGSRTDVNAISTMSGPHQGLSLVLYLENDNGNNVFDGTYHTTSNIGNAAGVRVIVHKPQTRPSPMDQGLDVPPGFTANLGLTRTNFVRLNNPHGDCVEPNTRTSYDFQYSAHDCILTCQQEYVLERCGCISSLLPHHTPNQTNNFCAQWLDTEPEMNLTSFMAQTRCERDALRSYDESGLYGACACYPPCTENAYTSELSLSAWPLAFAQSSFFDAYVRSHPHAAELKAHQSLARFNDSTLIERGLIHKNFARVNVYLQSMTVEEYVQLPGYERANLLSDIGGTLGLWIGMSIITWCEVTELLCLLLYKMCRQLSARFQ